MGRAHPGAMTVVSDGSDFRQVAWGGVEFAVPREWEPRQVDARRLVLGRGTDPALELKWGAGPTGPPVKRLARAIHQRSGAFRDYPLPPEWQRALRGREGRAFEWTAGGASAGGACVRCCRCGRVCLIQFFDRDAPGWSERAVRVLASLADHRDDGRTRWRLFDVAVDLPQAFQTGGSRFHAGRFELRFQAPRRRLTLWRWAPAGALLQGQDLVRFAAATLGGAGLRFESAVVEGSAAAVAAPSVRGGIGARFAERVGWARRRAVRVWHLVAANRILGVDLLGPSREFMSEFEEICGRYGVDESTGAPGTAPGA